MTDFKKDAEALMNGTLDYGVLPLEKELTNEQKLLSSIAMALQAALVQFILEGHFDPQEQLHFIGHFQDFADRIFHGETLKLPQTNQTFSINSKIANVFYDSIVDACNNGSANFKTMQEAGRSLRQLLLEKGEQHAQVQAETVNDKPTLH